MSRESSLDSDDDMLDSIATRFYTQSGEAEAIMRVANFPNDLLSFLQQESLAVADTLRVLKCDSLVELGCYDGRLLQAARIARVPYLGIDLSPAAVSALSQKILGEGAQDEARAVVGDAMMPADWLGSVRGETPLIVLPFNLLGSFEHPAAVLRALKGSTGGYGLVSVFNSHQTTTEKRAEYYSACGLSITAPEPAPYGGIRFRGHSGFLSQSFEYGALESLMVECGVRVLDFHRNPLGHCVIFAL